MSTVFLSYSRKSKDKATSLVKDVEDLGHEVDFDQELSGGQVWWSRILEMIRNCDVFLFVLDPDSLASTACRRELQYAVDLGKPILPVLISGDLSMNLLPAELSKRQVVDFCDGNRDDIKSLASAFNKLPAAGDLPDPLPPPPEIPLSYLGSLGEKISTESALSADEQKVLLVDLGRSLDDEDTADDGRTLLEQLKARPDVLLSVAEAIDKLLGHQNNRTGVRAASNDDEDIPAGTDEEYLFSIKSMNFFSSVFERMGPTVSWVCIFVFGLAFIALANSTGVLWNLDNNPCFSEFNIDKCQPGYMYNFSWSITMLVVFPFLFYFVTRFYRRLREGVGKISRAIDVKESTLKTSIRAGINAKWILLLYLFFVPLWPVYFYSLRESKTWMWVNFAPPSGLVDFANSITMLGLITTLFQLVLFLPVIFLVRVCVYGQLLAQQIQHADLKPDRIDGFRGLPDLNAQAKDVSWVLFLLFVYVMSYVVDKLIVQEDIGQAYSIVAIYTGGWLFFFLYMKRRVVDVINTQLRKAKSAELERLRNDGTLADIQLVREYPDSLLRLGKTSRAALTGIVWAPMATLIVERVVVKIFRW